MSYRLQEVQRNLTDKDVGFSKKLTATLDKVDKLESVIEQLKNRIEALEKELDNATV